MHRNVSFLHVALCILFILGSSTLFSQVDIKERVEISPRPPLQKSSTRNVVLFAANPDSNQGRHQEGAILVQHPCTITVTATMDVQPGAESGYPPTDLEMFASSGLIAWYHGYPDGTHGSSGGTATYTATCGGTGVELWNTMGYDDVTNVTRSIGPSSATITFEGKLLRYWTFTATATLTATVDTRYDLASAALRADTLRLTRCLSSTSVHTILLNNAGESYAGVPCQSPPNPMTLAVQSNSDVVLGHSDQQGKQLSLSPGDLPVQLTWNYKGETQNSTATVTLSADGQAASIVLTLMARPDSAGELGSLAMSASPTSITQCDDGATINITALDRNGQPYTTGSCLDRVPMTVSVSPPSKATLVYSYGDSVVQGSTLTLHAGDTPVSLQWNYVVGDSGGSVVISAQSQDKSAETTVGLTVDPSPLAVSADVAPGEVRSGLKSLIDARVVAGCGKTVTPPTTTTFKFEVTDGLQWGYLYDPATGKSGTMLDGVKHVQGIAGVEYRAYGPEPPEEEDIPLTITASDESIGVFQTDIYVESNDIRVTAVPNPIHFGESTQWTIEMKNRDGTYSAIPSDWQTAFQLVTVDSTGYLYSLDSTQTGSTVYGAFQTASYYAKPRQVEPDSVNVSIFVTTVDPNVIISKVKDGKKPNVGVGTNKTKSVTTKVTKPGGTKNKIAMDDPPNLGPGLPYYGVGRVVVKKHAANFVKFVINSSKDTLEYKQTADLTVIAVNADSQEVAIDTSTAMMLFFDDGGPFVDFIRALGDTVETLLDNISYGTLRAGRIKIVGAKISTGSGPVNASLRRKLSVKGKSIPVIMQEGPSTSYPKSVIYATTVSDNTKVGSKVALFKPAIKVIAVQDSIKPFYPDPDYHNIYLIDTTESRTKVKVAVTVSGVLYTFPIPYAVRLMSSPVDSSGGHSHDTNRPKGKFGDSIRDTVEIKDFETGTDTLRTSYLASMFGGKERIIATLKDFAIADTDTVVVRIPRLVLLPVSEDYDMTGGTNEHHGPRLDDSYPNSRTPNNNHWIDSAIQQTIQDGARNFRNADWNTKDERMKINDISLPFGGGLDIYGQWRRDIQDHWRDFGHGSHRTGKDVDIENGNRLKKLQEALEVNGWKYQKESQATRYPHFHYSR